ncbi:MAG TPA: hypothetical protein VFA50_22450 [Stellaceae bacterium]|nr:hypothetical protein [Stellaceae bacterium]
MADGHEWGRNPDVDYERRDVPIGVIGLLALFAVVWLAIVPLVLSFGYPQSVSDTTKRLRVAMPEPRLQTDPHADLLSLRQREDARLSSYGWVDRQKGIVHIPIDEAMAKLARDGIPGWPGPKQ